MKQALLEVAKSTEHEVIASLMAWKHNRVPAGNRYSLGTKNQDLRYGDDGSLTLYASATPPDAERAPNWLPAPEGAFSLYVRCYWAEQAVLDGTWTPPQIQRLR